MTNTQDENLYTFNEVPFRKTIFDKVIRKDDKTEHPWTLHPDLQKAVFEGSLPSYSLEEQALHFYGKLCQIFSYDEGYFYNDKFRNETRYSSEISKEHLESIVPGSKVTCWDFARIFSKLVNELEGNIEAVIISRGMDGGHFLSGFYTDKVSLMLEPINKQKDGLNDFMKVKTGLQIGGIKIISDEGNIIPHAIDKVALQIIGKEPATVENYLNQLNSLPLNTVPHNLVLKLRTFIEVLKIQKLFGNDATQAFMALLHSGFFGEGLETKFLGKLHNENSQKTFRRTILINANSSTTMQSTMYLLDTYQLDLSSCTYKELLQELASGRLVRETKHRDTLHTEI